MSLSAIVCLAVALLQAAPLAPQEQRPPVFRGGATLVYVVGIVWVGAAAKLGQAFGSLPEIL